MLASSVRGSTLVKASKLVVQAARGSKVTVCCTRNVLPAARRHAPTQQAGVLFTTAESPNRTNSSRYLATTVARAARGRSSNSSSQSDEDADPISPRDQLGSDGEVGWYTDPKLVDAAWRITDADELEYWQAAVDKLEKTKAREAVEKWNVDLQWRLGISPDVVKAGRPPPNWSWYKQAKSKDPFAVVLLRNGTTYEAVGLDAVLLMDQFSYQLVRSETVPKTGFRHEDLQQKLQRLVEERGFDVAVWEERPFDGSRKGQQKERYCQQVVTPEDPVYLHGYVDSATDLEMKLPTIFGVSSSVRGLSVFRFNRNTNIVEVLQGPSDDGLWGLIKSDSSANPVVYIMEALHAPRPSSTAYASDAQYQLAQLSRSLRADPNVNVKRLQGGDPLAAFTSHLRKTLKLSTELQIRPAVDMMSWPGLRPLYLSTLQQLGLERTRGIPALVNYLLLDESPRVVRELVASLLSAPPSHEVAGATRQALRVLMSLDESIPGYQSSGSITAKKVTLVLAAGEAPEKFFQGLADALKPVIDSLDPAQRSPGIAAVVDAAWPLLQHTLSADSTTFTQQTVLQASQKAVAAMRQVVPGTGGAEAVYSSPGVPAQGGAQAAEVVQQFVEKMERFRLRVLPNAIPQEWEQVDRAFRELCTALDVVLYSIKEQARAKRIRNFKDRDLTLAFDDANSAVWIRISSKELQHMLKQPLPIVQPDVPAGPHAAYTPVLEVEQQTLHLPYDRNGSVVKKDYFRSCEYLDKCLQQYRDATAQAYEAASGALKDLTTELTAGSTQLAAAVQLGLVMTALDHHSRAAARKSWTLPLVGQEEQQQYKQQQQGVGSSNTSSNLGHSHGSNGSADSGAGKGEFHLRGLWPYWMQADSPNTVTNDVQLDGFMLLTGPNMAGKSTVLRSVAAAALCGCVGLAIPAAPGSCLPQLDAVVLRTFSGDAPQEGLSAFGVEMLEMSYVLDEVQAGSLVLIDELGKGTEVMDGTAIASAMLQELVASGARGIFATHLHLLLELLKDVPQVTQYKMEVVPQEQQQPAGSSSADDDVTIPHLRPTMRLLPGSCTESLALEVALQCGIPPEIVEAAVQEYHKLLELGGVQALIAATAAGTSRWGGSSSSSFSGSSSDQAEGNEGAAQQEQQGPELETILTPTAPDASAIDNSLSSTTSAPARLRALRRRPAAGGRPVSASSSSSEPPAEQKTTLAAALASADAEGSSSPSSTAISSRTRKARRRPTARSMSSSRNSSEPTADSGAASAAVAADDLAIKVSKVKVLLAQLALGLPLDANQALPEPVVAQQQQAGRAVATTVQRGAVHHLAAGEHPPPKHEGLDVVYVGLFEAEGGTVLWYCGETQKLLKRFKAHSNRKASGFSMREQWYVVIDPQQQDRKRQQAFLIKALADAGFEMLSTHDAALANTA